MGLKSGSWRVTEPAGPTVDVGRPGCKGEPLPREVGLNAFCGRLAVQRCKCASDPGRLGETVAWARLAVIDFVPSKVVSFSAGEPELSGHDEHSVTRNAINRVLWRRIFHIHIDHSGHRRNQTQAQVIGAVWGPRVSQTDLSQAKVQQKKKRSRVAANHINRFPRVHRLGCPAPHAINGAATCDRSQQAHLVAFGPPKRSRACSC